MKKTLGALTLAIAALGVSAGAASAGGEYRGYIFIKADKNNDGVLNDQERARAEQLTFFAENLND